MAKFVPVGKSNQQTSKPRFVPIKDKKEFRFTPPGRDEEVVISGEGRGSVGDALQGLGEYGLTTLTGALGQISGGITGLGSLVYSAITGEDDALQASVDRIQRVADAVTLGPYSESGKRITERFSQDASLRSLQKGAEAGGQFALEQTGSPAVAAATDTAIQFLPSLIGVKEAPRGLIPRQRSIDVQKIIKESQDLGVDISNQRRLIEGVTQAGRNMTGGIQRSDSLQAIQDAVVEARNQQKNLVNSLYEEARSTPAGVPSSQVKGLSNLLQDSLRSFDVEDLPIVSKRLNEIRQFETLPNNSAVKLNAISEFRQRINRHRAPSTDITQNAALDIMKGQLDEWLNTQFNSDMIKGSPEALTKWKEATKASQRYKELFKDNKVIKQMAEQGVDPEQMRAWIFNTSRTGLKRQANSVTKTLKEIVGERSPEFRALQQDAMLDIIDPLLEPTPNFKQFNRNYDQYLKNNPTLVKEFFPNSGAELRKLRSLSGAIDERKASKLAQQVEGSLERLAIAHTVGYGLARGAARMSLGRQIVKGLKAGVTKSERRKILGKMLGYDPGMTLLPKSPIIYSEVIRQADKNNEDREE